MINGSCHVCLHDSASFQNSQQEAHSHGQSWQETIFSTDSLGRKQKLVDLFIPCIDGLCKKGIHRWYMFM